MLVEDRSTGDFPDWFDRLGQDYLLGPLPFAVAALRRPIVVGWVVLARSATDGVSTSSATTPRWPGTPRWTSPAPGSACSSTRRPSPAWPGILFAARLGTVRGDMASGFELDIITIVLLGGVSIFGGSGRMSGVLLAVLIVLNLRNGFGLANVDGNFQTGVIGVILIMSVIAQNLIDRSATGPGPRGRPPRRACRRRRPPECRADATGLHFARTQSSDIQTGEDT